MLLIKDDVDGDDKIKNKNEIICINQKINIIFYN